jgi:hypothetical protein
LLRVMEALSLIERYDPLQYARVTHDLKRVWVNLLADARACFRRSLEACVLDERYVLAKTTTPEMIAKTIVHEATHARLERWGIEYEEKLRPRIEAICIRRELAFIAKLPNGQPLQEEAARKLEWCVRNPDHFSPVSFRQRRDRGAVEALRYLGIPSWLIGTIVKALIAISFVRRLVRRIARPAQQA